MFYCTVLHTNLFFIADLSSFTVGLFRHTGSEKFVLLLHRTPLSRNKYKHYLQKETFQRSGHDPDIHDYLTIPAFGHLDIMQETIRIFIMIFSS